MSDFDRYSLRFFSWTREYHIASDFKDVFWNNKYRSARDKVYFKNDYNLICNERDSMTLMPKCRSIWPILLIEKRGPLLSVTFDVRVLVLASVALIVVVLVSVTRSELPISVMLYFLLLLSILVWAWIEIVRAARLVADFFQRIEDMERDG